MKYLKKHIIKESQSTVDRYEYLKECFLEILDEHKHDDIEEDGDGYSISFYIKSLYENNIEELKEKIEKSVPYTDIEDFDINNMIGYHVYMSELLKDIKTSSNRFIDIYNNYKFNYNFYDSDKNGDKPFSYIVINIMEE